MDNEERLLNILEGLAFSIKNLEASVRNLEAATARLEAGHAKLESGLSGVETGQLRLEERMAKLETIQGRADIALVNLAIGQESSQAGIIELKAALLETNQRLEHAERYHTETAEAIGELNRLSDINSADIARIRAKTI